ncbi:sensor histidine kinase [Pseudonocardia sp. T1-2H]|uniref:sensor histidine kinase n=1 Tax=Pseudonocardia sp. T1-2H TaxID=3128899 RepID=UPI003101B328
MALNAHKPGAAFPEVIGPTALGAAGLALSASSAWIALANHGAPNAAPAALVDSVTVAILVGVGLFAWERDPASRFGVMLVAAGFGSFLASLSASGVPLLYSVGRVSFWILQPLLIYLFLAYPSGRLATRPERAVVAIAAATVVVLYLPTATLVHDYPLLPAYCSEACPRNVFQVVGAEPDVVGSLVIPGRELITIGIYVATAFLLLDRLRATRLMRHSLTPVLAAVILHSLALAAGIVARRIGAGAAVEALVWIALLTNPVAALGFLVGLLRWRVYAARVFERLGHARDEPSDPEQVRGRLAEALGDSSLELYYTGDGESQTWHDHAGRPVVLPSAPERCVVNVDDQGDVIAAIVCDPALNDQRCIVEAAGSWAAARLVRRRLTTALAASLRSVEASRRRLAVAAASERRRIERNLHDGAQQQLVMVRIGLALVEEEIARNPERGAELLRELAPRIDSVIDEVRSIARGIYPSLLADAGLAEALRDIARFGQPPIMFDAQALQRYPLEIEAAVYFCCVEALQNVTKHAHASAVSMELAGNDGELHFEVSDNGSGFVVGNGTGGAGLTNMRDRIAAIGGSLAIDSWPGRGTTVRGRVPIKPR